MTALSVIFCVAVARADQDGTINLLGPDGICIVDGDFNRAFSPGEPVEVSRFSKRYAFGYVDQVMDSYMVVKVIKRSPDYFLKEGDRVYKPLPAEKEKLTTIKAEITPDTKQASLSDIEENGKLLTDEEKQRDEMDVVDTEKSKPKSAAEVQALINKRGAAGGTVESDTSKGVKQGTLIGVKPNSGDDSAHKPKEIKIESRRRQKAVQEEEQKQNKE